MLDSSYTIYADSRFVAGLLTAPRAGYFRNGTDGTAKINMTPLDTTTATSATAVLDNYNTYSAVGISNEVTYNSLVDATTISAIAGPRGSATAINIVVDRKITNKAV